MSHFLHSIPWQAIAAIIAVAGTAYVSFRFGRRWRRGYREALANRKEYHALKADAQLRSAMHNEMRVDASPIINIGTGNGVQSELRDTRRAVHRGDDTAPFCAFCGRFGCRADCRKEMTSGSDDSSIHLLHDLNGATHVRRLASRATASLPRRRLPHGPNPISGLDDPTDIDADATDEDD